MNLTLILSSVFFSTTACIFIQKYFISKKKFAQINSRSSHSSIATNSGGISVFISIFCISCILYLNGVEIFDYKIFVPISLMTLIGLYDDLYEIDFKLKLVFQIIAAKIIVDQGYIITNLHGILGVFELSSMVAQIFTIFIIVSIINSINFIDGLDGLALTVILIFISSFEFFSKDYFLFDNLSLLLIFSIIPLWYFNFRKTNKIFLGDSGSLMLGTFVSIYTISILKNDYIIRPEYDIHKILFVISILFYPIIDIIRIFSLRIFNGKSPFVADKNHIHHVLLNRSKSHKVTVFIIFSITLATIFIIQSIF